MEQAGIRQVAVGLWLLLAVALTAAGVVVLLQDESEEAPRAAAAAAAHPPGSYPPAPSTAGPMTPEWRAFADQVDRICATNFNRSVANESALTAQAKAEGWSRRELGASVQRLWAASQGETYRMVGELGKPPAEAELLARWRENVGTRGELFARMAEATAAGDGGRADAIWSEITRLKAEADPMGQDFGLRICTSN